MYPIFQFKWTIKPCIIFKKIIKIDSFKSNTKFDKFNTLQTEKEIAKMQKKKLKAKS